MDTTNLLAAAIAASAYLVYARYEQLIPFFSKFFGGGIMMLIYRYIGPRPQTLPPTGNPPTTPRLLAGEFSRPQSGFNSWHLAVGAPRKPLRFKPRQRAASRWTPARPPPFNNRSPTVGPASRPPRFGLDRQSAVMATGPPRTRLVPGSDAGLAVKPPLSGPGRLLGRVAVMPPREEDRPATMGVAMKPPWSLLDRW